ncbi:MAG TPA: MFS transporter, partial [Novosphingobium sp.]|nr:MFS transporter [Novosphingobium sp.]
LRLPDTAAPAAHGQARAAPLPRQGWWVLAAMALFCAGSLAIWPFMERAAHAIGLSAARFGRYQSLATLLSAGGNALLALLAGRIVRRWALTAALLACGLACAGLTTLTLPGAFAAALVVYNVSWFLAYPLLLGLAYAADPGGRLAVMTTATWLLAESAAAMGAGTIAQTAGSYTIIGPLGLAGCVGALLLAWPLASRADAGQRRLAPPSGQCRQDG